MKVVMAFPACYDVVEVPGLPAGPQRVLYYPGAKPWAPYADVVLRVTPRAGPEWFAVFQAGSWGQRGDTGVYSCPKPEEMCVVVSGDAYVIDAFDPTVSEEVPVGEVVSVMPLVESGMLLLIGDFRIGARERGGMAWVTRQIALDGLEATQLEGRNLRGVATTVDGTVEFEVDLATGRVRGGMEELR